MSDRNIEPAIGEEKHNKTARIQEIAGKSADIFYQKEKKQKLFYFDFLYIQLRYMKKRWWLIQMFLLAGYFIAAYYILDSVMLQRSLGVTASLFIVMIIPEFWKDKATGSTELEATTCYTLRDIYAARLLLFGGIDAAFLFVFCLMLHVAAGVDLLQMVSQFFVPLVITACICFVTLCSWRSRNEMPAVTLCLIFSGCWWAMTMQQRIFDAVYTPVWAVFLAAGLIFLILSIRKTLQRAGQINSYNRK